MENEVDGTCVVFYIEPVSDILTFAVHRKRFSVADVIDKQWYQLFRELIRAVVVRAVRNDCRKAVGVVEGTDEVIRSGLGGRIWTMRIIAGIFTEEVCAVWRFSVRSVESEGPVDFVSRYVVESLFIKILPAKACGLQEGEGAHHIGLSKCEWILDGTVHVGFCGEVDYGVDLLLFHQLAYGVEVTDVHFHESIIRIVFDVFQIGKITGICELIDIYDAIARILAYKQPYNVAAYETGTAGDEDGSLH